MEVLIPVFAILIAIFLSVVTIWDLFKAAGEEGWKSLIPIYNIIVMLKISDLPLYWLIIFLIPLVQIVGFVVVFKKLVDEYRDEVIKVLVANIAAIIVACVGIAYGVIINNNKNAVPENGNIVNVEKPNTDINTNVNDIYNNINNNNIKNPSENTTNQNNTNVDNQINNNLTNESNTTNNISSSEVTQDTDYTGKRLGLYDNISSQNKIQRDKQKRGIERMKNGFIIIPTEPTNNSQANTQSTQHTPNTENTQNVQNNQNNSANQI